MSEPADRDDAARTAGGAAKPLAGRVFVVAGASRGLGRGVALGLGEAGASVICSARSTRFGARTEGRQETVEDTAELVEEAGGKGYPYVCDHTDTRALHDFAAWVLRRFGPPYGVVSAVWGGNEGFDGARHADGARFGTPFFRRSLAPLETAFRTGAFAAMATARAFAPLMLHSGGLFVAIGFDPGENSTGDPIYDFGKAGLLVANTIMARDLEPFGIACLHLTPGFTRTERVLDAGQGEEAGETPLYAGRAVAALAADPEVFALNGRSLFVADLAQRYGFTDIDGARPGRFDLSKSREA